jgi:hypothetical protein
MYGRILPHTKCTSFFNKPKYRKSSSCFDSGFLMVHFPWSPFSCVFSFSNSLSKRLKNVLLLISNYDIILAALGMPTKG